MILIVFNPVAGARKRIRQQLEQALIGQSAQWCQTQPNGSHLSQLKASDYTRVIVIGGDGTVQQTAQWLIDQQSTTPLAIVPAGSANLLAGAFNIPRSIGLAVSTALQGTPTLIDVGLINQQQVFLVAAGFGSDALAIASTSRQWKRLFGFWAYVGGVWRGIFHFHERNFRLSIDGQHVQHHAKTVFIMNFGKFFNIQFGPDVSPNDGQFSVAVVRPVAWTDYPVILARLLGRQFDWQKRLTYYSGQRIEITCDRRVPFQADGETLGITSPVSITVLPKRLAIVRG